MAMTRQPIGERMAAQLNKLVDNVQGGYLATQHLIQAGHRRIGHVSGPRGLFTVQERCEGYRRALAQAGIAFDEALVCFGSYEREFGATALAGLLALPAPPTAIFAASDYLAVGMLEALRDRAINVPRDMSIVGFDDMEFASLLMPPISTMRQSARDLGRTGVDMLLARLAGDAPPTVRRLPVRLIERASVAPPRTRS